MRDEIYLWIQRTNIVRRHTVAVRACDVDHQANV